MKLLLKILLWIVIIVAVLLLALFITSRIAQFESIPAMLDYMYDSVFGSGMIYGLW